MKRNLNTFALDKMRVDRAVQTIEMDQSVLELSGFPVTGAAPLMGYGDDLNHSVCDAVDYGIGESPKQIFFCVV